MPLGWVADNFFEIKKQIERQIANGDLEPKFKIGCRGGKLVKIITCEEKVNQPPHEYPHIMLVQGERFIDDPAVKKLLVVNCNIPIDGDMARQLEEVNVTT